MHYIFKIRMLVQMYVKQARYQRLGTQTINLQFKTIKYNVTYHKFFSAIIFYYPALV